MTTDSGFVLGAAVSVTCAAAGHPVLAVFAAMAAGACAGYVTAFLQTRMGVPSILAGIITNTGLYTVNLMVMGWSSNVSLLKQDTMFTLFRDPVSYTHLDVYKRQEGSLWIYRRMTGRRVEKSRPGTETGR